MLLLSGSRLSAKPWPTTMSGLGLSYVSSALSFGSSNHKRKRKATRTPPQSNSGAVSDRFGVAHPGEVPAFPALPGGTDGCCICCTTEQRDATWLFWDLSANDCLSGLAGV